MNKMKKNRASGGILYNQNITNALMLSKYSVKDQHIHSNTVRDINVSS